jgi:hypothetical protein
MEPQVGTIHDETNSADQKNPHRKNQEHSRLTALARYALISASWRFAATQRPIPIQNMILPTEFAEMVTLAHLNPNMG